MIEGAPPWYCQNKADHVCASGFAKGNFEVIDQARDRAQQAVVQLIDEATETMIYENFSANNNPAERELVKRFETDEALPRFMKATSKFHNIS